MVRSEARTIAQTALSVESRSARGRPGLRAASFSSGDAWLFRRCFRKPLRTAPTRGEISLGAASAPSGLDRPFGFCFRKPFLMAHARFP
jgi:hypothetical protein